MRMIEEPFVEGSCGFHVSAFSEVRERKTCHILKRFGWIQNIPIHIISGWRNNYTKNEGLVNDGWKGLANIINDDRVLMNTF